MGAPDSGCRCGKCCDGTMFPNAPLEPGEETLARSLGMTVTTYGGGRAMFSLPCPKVTPEGLCSIHDEQRPAVCSTFECPQPVE